MIVDDLQPAELGKDVTQGEEVFPGFLAKSPFHRIEQVIGILPRHRTIVLKVINIQMGAIGNQIAYGMLQPIGKSPQHGEVGAAFQVEHMTCFARAHIMGGPEALE